MTLFLLYLWLKLDTFSLFLGWITFFCIVIPAIGVIISALAINENLGYPRNEADAEKWRLTRKAWEKRIKYFAPVAMLTLTINVAMPTQKEGAYLIAGYAGLKLAETPEMGKLAEVVRLKVGNYLDDELTAARSEAAKKIKDAASATINKGN